MKRISFIILAVYLIYITEFILFNVLGKWFKPNLLLILVVFSTLGWGIRYGLLTGIISGLIKDSFSTCLMGTHLLAFVMAAYSSVLIRKYLYASGSYTSRISLIVFVYSSYFIITFLANLMIDPISIKQAFIYIFLPEVIITSLIINWFIYQIKRCVLRFSV